MNDLSIQLIKGVISVTQIHHFAVATRVNLPVWIPPIFCVNQIQIIRVTNIFAA